MKIFLDTEFTGLHQKTTLISLAMIAENGHEFYAEFNDYDQDQLNPWIEEHVLPKLFYSNKTVLQTSSENSFHIKDSSGSITRSIQTWFNSLNLHPSHKFEFWADVLAYDWVLFCQLFGGAREVPASIFFIPFDLSTLLLLNKIDPAISRFSMAGMDETHQHNALWDCRAEWLCYKILQEKS